jgi:hypothetical protein
MGAVCRGAALALGAGFPHHDGQRFGEFDLLIDGRALQSAERLDMPLGGVPDGI